ncbi:hypothetical protein, partial [Yersinia pestis]|uniref:hypothetical protein n=1 Tax=Yersinia pestis TaxID=632 RepID=UPI000A4FF111
ENNGGPRLHVSLTGIEKIFAAVLLLGTAALLLPIPPRDPRLFLFFLFFLFFCFSLILYW